MSINLKESRKFTITDFSGGINQGASSFRLAPNQLVDCDNIVLNTVGSIKSRKGEQKYQVQGFAGNYLATAVKGMHRYVGKDGTKKVLIYSGTYSGAVEASGFVYADSDDGNFDIIRSVLTYDGWLRFTQYKDTVFMLTDRNELNVYNPSKNAIATTFSVKHTMSEGSPMFEAQALTTGGTMPDGRYEYRFTYDLGWGDFLVETSPLYHYSLNKYFRSENFKYFNLDAIFSAGTNTNMVNIRKYLNLTLPQEVQRINVYRSDRLDSTTSYASKELPVYYIGSISATDYQNAVAGSELVWGDVLLVDDGIQPGPLAEYGKMAVVPYARFHVLHKSRLWLGHVRYETGTNTPWIYKESDAVYNPSGIFWSNINNHGEYEPLGFFQYNYTNISPNDGEGITAMLSYRNEFLLVWKANSMWAVLGDSPDNLVVRNISYEVGCIAPETVAICEGNVVWLSNSGVYYYDGSYPKPLNTDNIADAVSSILPARKYHCAGVYDSDRREYLLACSGGGSSNGYNRTLLRFDVRTKAWTKSSYDYGKSCFLQKRSLNEPHKLLAGIGENPGPMALYTAVERLNITGHEAVKINNVWPGIACSFQTPFYDGGYPYEDKKFEAVLIELSSPVDLTLHVLCDNRLDTRLDDAGGFTVERPVSGDLYWYVTPLAANEKWNDAADTYKTYWAATHEKGVLRYLDDRTWGKRISLILSWTSTMEVEVQSITVFYKPKEVVR